MKNSKTNFIEDLEKPKISKAILCVIPSALSFTVVRILTGLLVALILQFIYSIP